MEMQHIRDDSKMQHLNKAIEDLKFSMLTLSTNSSNYEQSLCSHIRQSISGLQDEVDKLLHERPAKERIGLETTKEEPISSCTVAMDHFQDTSEMQHLNSALEYLKTSILTLSTNSSDYEQSLCWKFRQSISVLQDQVDELFDNRPDEERMCLEINNEERRSSCSVEIGHICDTSQMQHVHKANRQPKPSISTSFPTIAHCELSLCSQMRQTVLTLHEQVNKLFQERPDEVDEFVSWVDAIFREMNSTLEKMKPTTEAKSASTHSVSLVEYEQNINERHEQNDVTGSTENKSGKYKYFPIIRRAGEAKH